jgi:hypothetical protein
MTDVSELRALSRDLGKLSARATGVMYGVVKDGAVDLRDTWKRNARLTSGQHGKRYPDSITYDTRVGTSIHFEIGPDPRLPQGGMSFENGSVKQPPHLDGQRAVDEIVPRIDRRVDTALTYLIGEANL